MSFAKYWARLRRSWSGKPPEEHEQQLMQLYWNRAELKKELSNQQSRNESLGEKLRVQEAATRRATEQQEQLQIYLGNPEYGANALVYFQLRALWKLCSEMLAKFGADLRQQQEDRERQRHKQDCEARRAEQVAGIGEQLLNAQSLLASLEARVQLQVSRKLELGRWWLPWLWNYSRRRELSREISHLDAQRHAATVQVRDFTEERNYLQQSQLEEFPGMSFEGKRLVNTAMLAFVEFMIASLPHRGLAQLSRDAMSVQVYDIRFGTREDCARLMTLTKTALQSLPGSVQNLSGLKELTDRLRARVAYRSSEDPVPIADSVQDAGVARGAPASQSGSLDTKSSALNVLVDDYFGISANLIR